jgi:hypothetical protein
MNTDTIELNITLNTNWPKQNKEAVGSARRLLQYCQLPDKNSRDISRDIWNFSQHFKIFICLFHDFSRKLWRCSTEPWLGNTVIDYCVISHKLSFLSCNSLQPVTTSPFGPNILLSTLFALGHPQTVFFPQGDRLNRVDAFELLQCVVLWASLAEWCPTLYLPTTPTHPLP